MFLSAEGPTEVEPTYRLVVPSSLRVLLRAEQTTATWLLRSHWRTMPSAMTRGSFPTLVPPNFCTIHGLEASLRTR